MGSQQEAPIIKILGKNVTDFRQEATNSSSRLFLSDLLVVQSSTHIVLTCIGGVSERASKEATKKIEQAIDKSSKILGDPRGNDLNFSLYSVSRPYTLPKFGGLGLDLKGGPVIISLEEFNKIHECKSPHEFILK